jgi:predicted dithiol-disulfide oxidoreductase (DUF899 family)
VSTGRDDADQRGDAMAEHRTGTREAWQAARDELLAMKKKLTQRHDQLAEKRRELPWVPIEKNYTFETDEGTRTLAQLFDGRPDRYRYDPRFRPTEGVSGVRRSRHPQRSGKGGEDIFPDPPSGTMAASWRSGAAEAVERQCAALVA